MKKYLCCIVLVLTIALLISCGETKGKPLDAQEFETVKNRIYNIVYPGKVI